MDYSEILECVDYLLGFLNNNIPKHKVMLLGRELANSLLRKFEKFWHPDKPEKDVANRILHINDSRFELDTLFADAAKTVGLDLEEVLRCWPKDLALSVNPRAVYCRVGNFDEPVLLQYGPKPQPCPLTIVEHVTSKGRVIGRKELQFKLNLPGDVAYTVGTFAKTRFGTSLQKTEPLQIAHPPAPPHAITRAKPTQKSAKRMMFTQVPTQSHDFGCRSASTE